MNGKIYNIYQYNRNKMTIRQRFMFNFNYKNITLSLSMNDEKWICRLGICKVELKGAGVSGDPMQKILINGTELD